MGVCNRSAIRELRFIMRTVQQRRYTELSSWQVRCHGYSLSLLLGFLVAIRAQLGFALCVCVNARAGEILAHCHHVLLFDGMRHKGTTRMRQGGFWRRILSRALALAVSPPAGVISKGPAYPGHAAEPLDYGPRPRHSWEDRWRRKRAEYEGRPASPIEPDSSYLFSSADHPVHGSSVAPSHESSCASSHTDSGCDDTPVH